MFWTCLQQDLWCDEEHWTITPLKLSAPVMANCATCCTCLLKINQYHMMINKQKCSVSPQRLTRHRADCPLNNTINTETSKLKVKLKVDKSAGKPTSQCTKLHTHKYTVHALSTESPFSLPATTFPTFLSSWRPPRRFTFAFTAFTALFLTCSLLVFSGISYIRLPLLGPEQKSIHKIIISRPPTVKPAQLGAFTISSYNMCFKLVLLDEM